LLMPRLHNYTCKFDKYRTKSLFERNFVL